MTFSIFCFLEDSFIIWSSSFSQLLLFCWLSLLLIFLVPANSSVISDHSFLVLTFTFSCTLLTICAIVSLCSLNIFTMVSLKSFSENLQSWSRLSWCFHSPWTSPCLPHIFAAFLLWWGHNFVDAPLGVSERSGWELLLSCFTQWQEVSVLSQEELWVVWDFISGADMCSHMKPHNSGDVKLAPLICGSQMWRLPGPNKKGENPPPVLKVLKVDSPGSGRLISFRKRGEWERIRSK